MFITEWSLEHLIYTTMSSSASYTSSCYPIAVQSVRDAISKDTQGDSKVFKRFMLCESRSMA